MIFPTLFALFSALSFPSSIDAQDYNLTKTMINDNTCLRVSWGVNYDAHSGYSNNLPLLDVAYADGNITYTGNFLSMKYNADELNIYSNYHNCNVFYQLTYRNADGDNLTHYLSFSYSYFMVDKLDDVYTSFSSTDEIYFDCYFYLMNATDYDNIVVAEGTTAYENSGEGQYNAGYDSGYHDGLLTGKADGYTNGYNVGHTDGYRDGYNSALGSHSFSFTNLFASISDTPILMIRRMFNFDIFGVSAISILLTLFTALIFIKIIKRVF